MPSLKKKIRRYGTVELPRDAPDLSFQTSPRTKAIELKLYSVIAKKKIDNKVANVKEWIVDHVPFV